MLRRLAVASVALSAAACAGSRSRDAAAEASRRRPPRRRAAHHQPAHFDLATCSPRELSCPSRRTSRASVGALVATRPQVLECLVDPKNRGPAAEHQVTVKTTVDATRATRTPSPGENLTPEGTACIAEGARRARAAGAAAPRARRRWTAESGVPATGRALAAVTHGHQRGLSDFAGAPARGARLCDCYADYKDSAPPMLTAALELPRRRKPTPRR